MSYDLSNTINLRVEKFNPKIKFKNRLNIRLNAQNLNSQGNPYTEPIIIYQSEIIQVKPEFPGGIEKFYSFVQNKYQMPEEEGLNGKVFVSFRGTK